jgi:hypothetical protein
MTVLAVRPEIAEELEAAEDLRRDAEAAYIAALNGIVELSTLTGGRHGYDFQVEVRAALVHETTQQLVDLEYNLRDRFGVHFRTYVIPT